MLRDLIARNEIRGIAERMNKESLKKHFLSGSVDSPSSSLRNSDRVPSDYAGDDDFERRLFKK
jgi:hypothetical protein